MPTSDEAFAHVNISDVALSLIDHRKVLLAARSGVSQFLTRRLRELVPLALGQSMSYNAAPLTPDVAVTPGDGTVVEHLRHERQSERGLSDSGLGLGFSELGAVESLQEGQVQAQTHARQSPTLSPASAATFFDAHVGAGPLLVVSLLQILRAVLCVPFAVSTPDSVADVVLSDLTRMVGSSLVSLCHSASPVVVAAAAELMHAILRLEPGEAEAGVQSGAHAASASQFHGPTMQQQQSRATTVERNRVTALREGILLRHLHQAIFSANGDIRRMSRFLVEQWCNSVGVRAMGGAANLHDSNVQASGAAFGGDYRMYQSQTGDAAWLSGR